jgi:hypothetical protein
MNQLPSQVRSCQIEFSRYRCCEDDQGSACLLEPELPGEHSFRCLGSNLGDDTQMVSVDLDSDARVIEMQRAV